MEKGLKIQIDAGIPYDLGFFYAVAGMVDLACGDLKKAQHRAEEALKTSQKNHQQYSEGFAWILLGRTLGKADKSQINKAEECILQGIKILDGLKLIPYYTPGYYFLGELFADIGQKDKALENLKKSEKLFQEMGMDYWLTGTQKIMSRL
jgi:tetratricopeptide (TPR) repeat protein